MPIFATLSHYESNFSYRDIRKFMASFTDKLHFNAMTNKIKKKLFFWSSYLAKCPLANLCLRLALSHKSKESLTSKNTSLNRQNLIFQLLMARILWVIWPAAMMQSKMNWLIGNKTWCKREWCAAMKTSVNGVCFLEISEICKLRVSSTSFLHVGRSDPHFVLWYPRRNTSLVIWFLASLDPC